MSFYQKFGKRVIDIFLSILGILILWPVFLLITILIKFDSPGSAIFKQKRVGKNGKIFTLYKFRTMVKDAEKLKGKYRHLNEAGGPVFKIKNDPRYTRFGKILSRTGLDELPQLINILKGEMGFVGPRPLPIDEEVKINPKYRKIRRLVQPGLTSPWVTNGAQHTYFQKWMESDLKYIGNFSLKEDVIIILKTLILVAHSRIFNNFKD
jgi:lipopolysaccharide/colanic/teichoic acid biosynthesis glycosyltransferase